MGNSCSPAQQRNIDTHTPLPKGSSLPFATPLEIFSLNVLNYFSHEYHRQHSTQSLPSTFITMNTLGKQVPDEAQLTIFEPIKNLATISELNEFFESIGGVPILNEYIFEYHTLFTFLIIYNAPLAALEYAKNLDPGLLFKFSRRELHLYGCPLLHCLETTPFNFFTFSWLLENGLNTLFRYKATSVTLLMLAVQSQLVDPHIYRMLCTSAARDMKEQVTQAQSDALHEIQLLFQIGEERAYQNIKSEDTALKLGQKPPQKVTREFGPEAGRLNANAFFRPAVAIQHTPTELALQQFQKARTLPLYARNSKLDLTKQDGNIMTLAFKSMSDYLNSTDAREQDIVYVACQYFLHAQAFVLFTRFGSLLRERYRTTPHSFGYSLISLSKYFPSPKVPKHNDPPLHESQFINALGITAKHFNQGHIVTQLCSMGQNIPHAAIMSPFHHPLIRFYQTMGPLFQNSHYYSIINALLDHPHAFIRHYFSSICDPFTSYVDGNDLVDKERAEFHKNSYTEANLYYQRYSLPHFGISTSDLWIGNQHHFIPYLIDYYSWFILGNQMHHGSNIKDVETSFLNIELAHAPLPKQFTCILQDSHLLPKDLQPSHFFNYSNIDIKRFSPTSNNLVNTSQDSSSITSFNEKNGELLLYQSNGIAEQFHKLVHIPLYDLQLSTVLSSMTVPYFIDLNKISTAIEEHLRGDFIDATSKGSPIEQSLELSAMISSLQIYDDVEDIFTKLVPDVLFNGEYDESISQDIRSLSTMIQRESVLTQYNIDTTVYNMIALEQSKQNQQNQQTLQLSSNTSSTRSTHTHSNRHHTHAPPLLLYFSKIFPSDTPAVLIDLILSSQLLQPTAHFKKTYRQNVQQYPIGLINQPVIFPQSHLSFQGAIPPFTEQNTSFYEYYSRNLSFAMLREQHKSFADTSDNDMHVAAKLIDQSHVTMSLKLSLYLPTDPVHMIGSPNRLLTLKELDQLSILSSGVVFHDPFEIPSQISSKAHYIEFGMVPNPIVAPYHIIKQNSSLSTTNQKHTELILTQDINSLSGVSYQTSVPSPLHIVDSSTSSHSLQDLTRKVVPQMVFPSLPANFAAPFVDSTYGVISGFNANNPPGLLWFLLLYAPVNNLDDMMDIITRCRIDITNHLLQTPLMYAIIRQAPEQIINAMLTIVPNNNQQDLFLRTVSHYFMMTASFNTYSAQTLIPSLFYQHGVVVDVMDTWYNTPLTYALVNDTPSDYAKLLMDFTLSNTTAQQTERQSNRINFMMAQTHPSLSLVSTQLHTLSSENPLIYNLFTSNLKGTTAVSESVTLRDISYDFSWMQSLLQRAGFQANTFISPVQSLIKQKYCNTISTQKNNDRYTAPTTAHFTIFQQYSTLSFKHSENTTPPPAVSTTVKSKLELILHQIDPPTAPPLSLPIFPDLYQSNEPNPQYMFQRGNNFINLFMFISTIYNNDFIQPLPSHGFDPNKTSSKNLCELNASLRATMMLLYYEFPGAYLEQVSENNIYFLCRFMQDQTYQAAGRKQITITTEAVDSYAEGQLMFAQKYGIELLNPFPITSYHDHFHTAYYAACGHPMVNLSLIDILTRKSSNLSTPKSKEQGQEHSVWVHYFASVLFSLRLLIWIDQINPDPIINTTLSIIEPTNNNPTPSFCQQNILINTFPTLRLYYTLFLKDNYYEQICQLSQPLATEPDTQNTPAKKKKKKKDGVRPDAKRQIDPYRTCSDTFNIIQQSTHNIITSRQSILDSIPVLDVATFLQQQNSSIIVDQSTTDIPPLHTLSKYLPNTSPLADHLDLTSKFFGTILTPKPTSNIEGVVWNDLVTNLIPHLTIDRVQPLTLKEAAAIVFQDNTTGLFANAFRDVLNNQSFNYRNIANQAYNTNITQATQVAMQWFQEYLQSIPIQ